MAFASHVSQSQLNGLKGFSKVIDSLKASFARAMDAHIERHSRGNEIERLQAMTDEELAVIGVKRDRIAFYVFRDQMYI